MRSPASLLRTRHTVQNSFGGSIGGPLNIPKIYHGGTKTFFFVNYNGKRGENPFDQFSTVPTLLERQGNFSQTTYTSGAEGATGRDVQSRDQYSLPGQHHSGFASQDCPRLAVQRRCGLLPYIPMPESCRANYQNFHFVTSATNDSDDLNVRINHTFGAAPAGGRRGGRGAPRNNLTFGLHYHGSSADHHQSLSERRRQHKRSQF